MVSYAVRLVTRYDGLVIATFPDLPGVTALGRHDEEALVEARRALGRGIATLGASGDGPPHLKLSDREFEVFKQLAGGAGPTEVAQRLHLSVKAVSTHKTRILENLGLAGTAELVRYALEHKLL